MMKTKAIPFFFLVMAMSCLEEPVKEDVPELITKVILTFTPSDGSAPVEAMATDPDGEGIQNLTTNGVISLSANRSYTLNITLLNELADRSSPSFDITDEVEEEGAEHIILYSWTDGLFLSPSGDGNLDNRSDDINYNDQDANGLPIGINTSWTSALNSMAGEFRIVLKHQPELKSTTSGVDVGETDLDVTFDIEVK